MWTAATTAVFDEWFTGLGKTAEGRDAQVEIRALVEVLTQIGPTLGRPYVDTLKGSKHANLKELRGKTSDMVIRVAFAFDPTQKAILLVGGDKSGVSEKRFYRSLIDRAEALYDKHLAELKKVQESKVKERPERSRGGKRKKGGK